MTATPCVLCGAKEFASGLCLDCIAPAIALVRVQTTARRSAGLTLPESCCFCCNVATKDAVMMFAVPHHWLCVMRWCVAARREKAERKAAREFRTDPSAP